MKMLRRPFKRSTPEAPRPCRRRGARGFTFVELLLSLTILGIGVSGVIAMQKVTVTSNQHAKNLAIATQVAQAWIDALQADAVQWNHPSSSNPVSDLPTTDWLSLAPAEGSGPNRDWVRPTWNARRQFGPGFTAQGRPVDPATSPNDVRFCTHIRLSWLYPQNGVITGNGLLRAEVRVFWLREGGSALGNVSICDPSVNPNAVGAETRRYHQIYEVTAVRENTAL
ncbi:MAG TPA: prepilin-type N-terminal cleavage/methylation domain-containing protein [Polyangiaceae bacterium]|nr:prepilin-type N-terminal cleavage/methylation domain-containing protein [Polyangiaceae bacterium]